MQNKTTTLTYLEKSNYAYSHKYLNMHKIMSHFVRIEIKHAYVRYIMLREISTFNCKDF